MDVQRIDHVNIRIPEDGVEDVLRFYRDILGGTPEKLEAFRAGDRTSFAVRLADTVLIHVRPVDDFQPPAQANYDHFCIVVDDPIDTVKDRFEDAGVEIRRESTPWGSQGRAPAVYVEDPFGYVIEVKTAQPD